MADSEALAREKGWQVVRIIKDESVSAFRKPPWERPNLGPWLVNPDAEILIGWKLDRVIRRMTDFWELHRRLTDQGVMLVTYIDRVDMSTTPGQMMAGNLAGLAQMESENTSLRQKAARARQIQQGRAVGGKRPWPFQAVPNPHGPGRVYRPIPARAEALREAAAALTERRTSILAVCRRWNQVPELRPDSGAEWRVTPLRSLLANPVIAGATNYHGQPVRNDDGTIRIDPDRQILTWTEFERLTEALAGWSRQRQQRGPRTLLAGVLFCDACGGPLSPNRHGKYPRYQCTDETCTAQSSVNMAAADEYVTGVYLDMAADWPVLTLGDPLEEPGDVAELREAVAATNEQIRLIATGEDDSALERLPALRQQRAELQRRIDEAGMGQAVPLIDSGETYGDKWHRSDTAGRGAMISTFLYITVKRAGQGKRFSPDNLIIRHWDELTDEIERDYYQGE